MYVSSTTPCICILLLPRHFCRSSHVSFHYVSLVFMFILHGMKGVGSQVGIVSSNFLMELDIVLTEVPVRPIGWASTSIASFLSMSTDPLTVILAILAHWAYYLFQFIGFLKPIFFTFTSYYVHRPGCHSCHVSPLGLLPIFLGFPGPITLP